MKTKSLLRALEKAGVGPVASNGRQFYARFGGRVISWYDQDGEAIAVSVRSENDRDDPQSDYFAGSFTPTLKTALRWIRNGWGLPAREEAAQ